MFDFSIEPPRLAGVHFAVASATQALAILDSPMSTALVVVSLLNALAALVISLERLVFYGRNLRRSKRRAKRINKS